MAKKWDFSGWATKAGIKCSDGRTILPNAFSGNDGMEVPLVWNHRHNDPSEVLGHALLENRDEGVYAYCSFNDNPKGREAKELVRHGDIKALSIYANQLIQSSSMPPCDVIHGSIREVSLVLAGANVGAFIDNVMVHGETLESEAEIYHGDYDEDFLIYHADEDEDEDEEEEETKDEKAPEKDKKTMTVKDILGTLTPDQKAAVGILIESVGKNKGAAVKHADEPEDEAEDDGEAKEGETIGDVFNTLSEKQKKVVYAMIGMALENKKGAAVKHADEDDAEEDDGEAKEGETIGDVFKTLSSKQRKAVEAVIGMALAEKKGKDSEEDTEMKHNVFENYDNEPVISREEQAAIIKHAFNSHSTLKNVIMAECTEGGSLAHAITDHNGNSVTYGVANIDYLFPDARAINNTPELIGREQDWVTKVINGTHHTPFSKVKSLYADITGEDARARGYIKAHQKVEEVIKALKRETSPKTIYKKQKLDRDDIIDIVDFDVVAWLKAEMQIMLKEEIARAILIGDGRADTSDDKIDEDAIRPIATDNELFTVKVGVNVANNATDNTIADTIIDAVIKSRKNYKGSGNPTFFINEDYLTLMLLLKDGMGRRIYETEASLASALRVKELIPVEVMENQNVPIPTGQGTATADKPLIGIIVNLQDYNVGADKGGATQFFDDFDIDFNQMKYLYETRMSGALIKPYSAMTVYLNQAE